MVTQPLPDRVLYTSSGNAVLLSEWIGGIQGIIEKMFNNMSFSEHRDHPLTFAGCYTLKSSEAWLIEIST